MTGISAYFVYWRRGLVIFCEDTTQDINFIQSFMYTKHHSFAVLQIKGTPFSAYLIHYNMLVSPARANFEPVALRPRHSPFPMLPVEEAMETVFRHAPSMSIIELSSLQGVPTDLNPTHSYLWSSLVPRLSPVAWE